MNYYPDGYYLAGFGVAFVMIITFYLVLLLGSYALYAWLLGRVFRKAGIPQWKAWVPIYNSWVFLELGGQQGWLAILAFIPIANIVAVVFLCIAAYNVGLAFGKDGAWVILYIFIPWLWLALVGFDASRWEPWRSPVPPVYGANVSPPSPPAAPSA
ncbi:MAG: DUF5684 domain-containing protein [Lacisediminihabitans sp.]